MSPGDRVRLVAIHGVASPSMKAQLGKTGTVLGARREGESFLVHASFPTRDGPDSFWLKPGEFEVVEVAPVPPPIPPTTRPLKETAVSPPDFATTVQARIDALAQDDAVVVAQLTELSRQRGEIARERRALEAARTAYRRVTEGVGGARPVETPAVVFVRRWAREHGGLVVLGEAVPAALATGVCDSAEQARDRVTWAARRHGRRVSKGVYELRVEAAS